MIQWNKLNSVEQLEELKEQSFSHPILIFKHSTRCSISAAAIDRMERKWNQQEMAAWKPYYLDLIAYRPVSSKIESLFGIDHQSPQAIVLYNGEAIYDASHFSISYDDIRSSVPAEAPGS